MRMYQVVGTIFSCGAAVGYRVVDIETLKFSSITKEHAMKLVKVKNILGMANAVKDTYGVASEGDLGEQKYSRYYQGSNGKLEAVDKDIKVLVCRVRYGYIVTDGSELCRLCGIERVIETNSRGKRTAENLPINIRFEIPIENVEKSREICYRDGTPLFFKKGVQATVNPKVVEVNNILETINSGYYLTSDRDIMVCEPNLIKNVVDIDGIKTLGKYGGFYGCNNLKAIRLGSHVKILTSTCLAYCPKLESVELGKSVNFIGDMAFAYDINLKSVKMNEGLRSIGQLAFYKNDLLEELVLPSTIAQFHPNFIDKCNRLKRILVPESIEGLFRNWEKRDLIKTYTRKGEKA